MINLIFTSHYDVLSWIIILGKQTHFALCILLDLLCSSLLLLCDLVFFISFSSCFLLTRF